MINTIEVRIHTDSSKKIELIEVYSSYQPQAQVAQLSPTRDDERGFELSFDGANDWYLGDGRRLIDAHLDCIRVARMIAVDGGEGLKHNTNLADQYAIVRNCIRQIPTIFNTYEIKITQH